MKFSKLLKPIRRPFSDIRFALLSILVLLSVIFLVSIYYSNATHINSLQKTIDNFEYGKELIELSHDLSAHYKDQITAWKNILIRGEDIEQYHNYLSDYYKSERASYRSILNISSLIGNDNSDLSPLVDEITESHKEFASSIREALRTYNNTEIQAYKIADSVIYKYDEYHKGLIENLTQTIHDATHVQQQEVQNALDREIKIQQTLTYMSLFAVVVLLVWYIDSKVGKPLKHALLTARRLAKDTSISGEDNVIASTKKLSEALSEAELRITALFASTVEGIYCIDNNGNCTFANPACAELLGYDDVGSLIGKNMHQAIQHSFSNGKPFPINDSRINKTLLQGGIESSDDEVYWRKDGTCFPVEYHCLPLKKDNYLSGAIISFSNIVDRKHHEAVIKDSNRMLSEKVSALMLMKQVIESTTEGIVITDVDGVIVDVNPAYERITGYDRDELIGAKPSIAKSERHDENFYKELWGAIKQTGHWEGEVWDRRKNGEAYPQWLSINAIYDRDHNPVNYAGMLSDITNQKATEEALEKLAYYDPLTSLPNRTLFNDRIKQEIFLSDRNKSSFGLLFIDLDHFKYVNDNLGHVAGDTLLVITANRLKQRIRKSDSASRLGGDEFTVIISNIDNPQIVSNISQDIIDALNEPITISNQDIRVGASIGIAIYPQDGKDIDTLSKHADTALYHAKDLGRNKYKFFSIELQEKISKRLKLQESMHKALEGKLFTLYYQPKLNLEDLSISGMEALIRWPGSQGKIIQPPEFIPLAEETGMIIPIGEWVLDAACMNISTFNRLHNNNLRVAINLSAKQLQDKALFRKIENAISRHNISPENLEIEITESMVMKDVDNAIEVMIKLRSLGVTISMDDFGTGFSSLSYLKKLPINSLKIDKSFINKLAEDLNDATIVSTIISMAKQLDLNVIAEGVETEGQLSFLRENGCNEIQGYYFSCPLPFEEFNNFIFNKSNQNYKVSS